MRQFSPKAWEIAGRFSSVLASETRDLAAAIDDALASPALTEWRDARQAIFDHQMDKPSDETRARFARLAEAEHTLMTVARTLP